MAEAVIEDFKDILGVLDGDGIAHPVIQDEQVRFGQCAQEVGQGPILAGKGKGVQQACCAMMAVLIASLLEYYVRQHIAQNKKLLKGLMPENRDNHYPTAEKLLKAFQDYSLVVARSPHGRYQVHYPKPRPIQKQILDILATLPPNPI